jgi:hypothetical protein
MDFLSRATWSPVIKSVVLDDTSRQVLSPLSTLHRAEQDAKPREAAKFALGGMAATIRFSGAAFCHRSVTKLKTNTHPPRRRIAAKTVRGQVCNGAAEWVDGRQGKGDRASINEAQETESLTIED